MRTQRASLPSAFQRALSLAFTLPEMLISMALMVILVGGVVAANLFGLRMYEVTKAKLGANDEARAAIAKMVDEIRAAKILRVGNGSLTSFSEVGTGSAQAGSAIQMHATTNTNSFVRYFWDSADNRLKRTTNGSTAAFIVANFISNSVVFRAEDHLGNVLTNNQNNRVINMKLEFYQLQYPIVQIGPGNLYDYYKLETRITRRALE